ncbi:oxygenase MpaB family protein [Glutamicibacter sp.]|uniref:oxygenase MpaB family protein n=1 Tax=Glutamicibacter sp. TaxID=1931995 RepID=UPI003D6B5313
MGRQKITGQNGELFSRIAPEAGLLLGAGRAILLQLAHPQIGRAIAEHSDFAANPLSRLIHTLGYIYALSNGTAQQQRKIIAHVDAAHRPIRATRDNRGPAYSALDPRLQLWVAATLYDSARVIAGQIMDENKADLEALYLQYARLGDALQMPSSYWPRDLNDFEQYFAQNQAALEVTNQTRALARELFEARHAPWWIRIGMPLMRDVTIAQLPASVREGFGYRLTGKAAKRNARVIAAAKAATRLLPRFIRHAPMRLILRRVDKMA